MQLPSENKYTELATKSCKFTESGNEVITSLVLVFKGITTYILRCQRLYYNVQILAAM